MLLKHDILLISTNKHQFLTNLIINTTFKDNANALAIDNLTLIGKLNKNKEKYYLA
jgi:hypothetical protein